jgi:hypothetical protein
MENIFPGSLAVYSSSLDLAYLPPTDIGIISSDFSQIYAGPGFKDGHNLTFVVSSSSTQYIDLKESYLYLRLKKLKKMVQIPNLQL